MTSNRPWKVTLVDTGEASLTGGRLARVRDYLTDTFCFTYGDGVADVDIGALVAHHRQQGRQATRTAEPAPGALWRHWSPFEGRYPASEINDGPCPGKPDRLRRALACVRMGREVSVGR